MKKQQKPFGISARGQARRASPQRASCPQPGPKSLILGWPTSFLCCWIKIPSSVQPKRTLLLVKPPSECYDDGHNSNSSHLHMLSTIQCVSRLKSTRGLSTTEQNFQFPSKWSLTPLFSRYLRIWDMDIIILYQDSNTRFPIRILLSSAKHVSSHQLLGGPTNIYSEEENK